MKRKTLFRFLEYVSLAGALAGGILVGVGLDRKNQNLTYGGAVGAIACVSLSDRFYFKRKLEEESDYLNNHQHIDSMRFKG